MLWWCNSWSTKGDEAYECEQLAQSESLRSRAPTESWTRDFLIASLTAWFTVAPPTKGQCPAHISIEHSSPHAGLCFCVGVSVSHKPEPYKNGWSDRRHITTCRLRRGLGLVQGTTCWTVARITHVQITFGVHTSTCTDLHVVDNLNVIRYKAASTGHTFDDEVAWGLRGAVLVVNNLPRAVPTHQQVVRWLRTFDGEVAWRLCGAMLVATLADVVPWVLQVDLVDDETAPAAVRQHLDVLRPLHRLVIVQPRYLRHTDNARSCRFSPNQKQIPCSAIASWHISLLTHIPGNTSELHHIFCASYHHQ